ncbi:uncharacterized protein LOC125802502 [Astyanax mexicanus]|uniref:uncharacterized protein LOC125802502 n=1 Tax=Astyanax mexicanus TaxID=7994 RepID=UPI0020CB463F|nr:uncharacterized protein LOC125802502 [Astyanax mexicanus]
MEGEEERQQIQLQDAARHIVGMLRKALKSPSQNDGAPVQRGQTSGTPGSKRQMVSRPVQPTVSTASRSKLDENMARSFPGLFKKNCSRPRKRAVKSKHVQFFLLDKVTDRTPKTGEEMVLLQAGLGRRTVSRGCRSLRGICLFSLLHVLCYTAIHQWSDYAKVVLFVCFCFTVKSLCHLFAQVILEKSPSTPSSFKLDQSSSIH